MNRRSFIGSILALGCAPAIVRADSLMRIVPREAWPIVLSAAEAQQIVRAWANGRLIYGKARVWGTVVWASSVARPMEMG